MSNLNLVAFCALIAVVVAFDAPPAGSDELSEQEKRKQPILQLNSLHRSIGNIPDFFNAGERWPDCPSIQKIRNQGRCGTCWAVSAASVLSDRICIASGGQRNDVDISAGQAATCTRPERTPAENCKGGGAIEHVFNYSKTVGLPTGGDFDSGMGCVPYPVAPGTNTDFSCSSECTNGDYDKDINEDGQANTVSGYWTIYKSTDPMTQENIDEIVQKVQTDMMVNGPVALNFRQYSDFSQWTPDMPPYCEPQADAEHIGGHAVKVVGWGVTDDDVRYWNISNSWGEDPGDNGFWKTEMGKNCVDIDDSAYAPNIVASGKRRRR